jgi:glycosyltransferase involved in cell wall biosynthesis
LVHDSKPHVILVAYYFPPAPQIGGLRPFRFRKYLQRAGYPCHVITASPPADGGSPDRVLVADELQQVWDGGARGRLSFEGWQELLLRKAAFPGHVGLVWSRKMAEQCRQIMAQHPHQRFVLYSTYPPMGGLSAGLIARWRENIPWIADFRDPILTGAGMPPPLRMRAVNRALEAVTFRLASSVIANTEGMAKVWRERYSVAQRKLHVIFNGFDPEDAPRPREIPPRANKLLVHAGALYHGRNPQAIVESLARLRARAAPEALAARVLLLGSIDEKSAIEPALGTQAQQEGWLEMRPPVPRAESQRLLEEADGLLLVQPHTRVQIPGKLFEYICIGRPILALVPRLSAVEPILKDAEAPHVCVYPDDDPQTVDAKLLAFLRLPSAPVAMNDWFRNNFNAKAQTEKLASLIDQAVV